MRKKLHKQVGERKRFQGEFVRYGTKPDYWGRPEKTVLLRHIIEVESGHEVADHLWFNLTKGFAALGELHAGDVIAFDARVKEYRKGYRGHNIEKWIENPPRTDCKLSYPSKIELVRRASDERPTDQ